MFCCVGTIAAVVFFPSCLVPCQQPCAQVFVVFGIFMASFEQQLQHRAKANLFHGSDKEGRALACLACASRKHQRHEWEPFVLNQHGCVVGSGLGLLESGTVS